jgi:hypothetical protein
MDKEGEMYRIYINPDSVGNSVSVHSRYSLIAPIYIHLPSHQSIAIQIRSPVDLLSTSAPTFGPGQPFSRPKAPPRPEVPRKCRDHGIAALPSRAARPFLPVRRGQGPPSTTSALS